MGDASGPHSSERNRLQQVLSAGGKLWTDQWRTGCSAQGTSLILGCQDGRKQTAVRGIQQFYSSKGVNIADSEVYFFDDRADNVRSFGSTPYNANQISCNSRDNGGVIGLCGARTSEIKKVRGVHTCGKDAKDLGMADATTVVV